MSARALAAALLLLAIAAPAGAEDRDRVSDARLGRLSRDFLEGWRARRPHLATRLGLHRDDARLVPVTQSSLRTDLEWLQGLASRLDAVPRAGLAPADALERDLLAARLAAERAGIEVARRWERDPAAYLDLVGDGVASPLERGAGSTCDRARAITGRLEEAPDVLRQARVNLRRPPRLLIEEALPGFERALRLYRGDVPGLGIGCREPRTQADLAEADSAAVRAVEEFLDYLHADLQMQADGPAALGPEATRLLLEYAEMESTPADTLIERGRRELQEMRPRVAALSGRPEPGSPDTTLLHSDSLLVCFERALTDIRTFLDTHAVVTLPRRERLRVRETAGDGAARAAGDPGAPLAALDAPGPFEERALDSWLAVAVPDTGAYRDPEGARLGALDRGSVAIVALREGIPGRWLQALARRRAPTPLMRATACATATEGWAQYAPQMMLEQGYGAGDPRCRRALLEDLRREVARCVVTLSIHAQGMTLDEAAAFLEREGPLAPAVAARAARRCAAGLEAAMPTLGRWRILDLRAEQQARLGAGFDLRAFHDALLARGAIPLPLVRQALSR